MSGTGEHGYRKSAGRTIGSRQLVAVVLACVLSLSGCATLNAGKKETVGAIAGAGGGAAIGSWVGKRIAGNTGAVIGAGIGSIIGDRIGKAFDERDKRLAALQKKYPGVEIRRKVYPTVGKSQELKMEMAGKSEAGKKKLFRSKAIYKVELSSERNVEHPLFRSGSRKLSPRMKRMVRKVLIIGHADSSGAARMNQRLSELRARTVAMDFRREGYPAADIYYQGAGEAEPVADNDTEEGRARNRRVEIIDASSAHNLGLAKRYSIGESRQAMRKVRQSSGHKQAEAKTARKAIRVASSHDAWLPLRGKPYHGQKLLEYGERRQETESKSMFATLEDRVKNLFPMAHAANATPIPSFLNDEMPTAGAIQRLDGGSSNVFAPDDYLQGYVRRAIHADLRRGGSVVVYPVPVLRGRALPGGATQMLLLHNKRRKDYPQLNGGAVLYVAGSSMLYRWKAAPVDARRSGILGIDLLLPTISEKEMQRGREIKVQAQIYYVHRRRWYVAHLTMRMPLVKQRKKMGVIETFRRAWLPGGI